MLKEAIDRIIDLAKPEMFKIGGLDYASKPVVPVKPPSSKSFDVHTLSGVRDFLVGNPDSLDLNRIIVHVASHQSVHVFSSLGPTWKERDFHVNAALIQKSFLFGSYISTEEMIIALQTYFLRTPTTDTLMKVVGNISDDTSVKTLDDGVSQEVIARAGIARLANMELPNPIVLHPYRTFLEVEQPESRFVFRLKKKEGGLPVCALFEADGGNWQLQAIQRVRDWLRVNLPEQVSTNIIA